MSQNSYRTILRSSSIIGGAQVINIVVGLIRMKVVALLLGPAGVGLAGLYLSLLQTASTVASMGVGTVGTRQIAAAQAEGGDEAVGSTRRALFWGTLILALLGAAVFWLASGFIARSVLQEPQHANDIAWLSLGVALTVAAGAQGALLTGLRRVGDLARMNIGMAVLGTALGVLIISIWGAKGLPAMVLIGPAVSFILGHVFVSRLPAPAGQTQPFREMSREWQSMLRLGFAFMISGLVTTAGHLAVRALVQREAGAEALGQFQAAWAIGSTYLGFVLGAMGTDFYPRLSAVIGDKEAATRLVNEQTEVALLLCGPVLLVMLGLAPWVIRVLYSAEFTPAVDILRWQLLGDVLKVMSWPLGFVLLASGAGKAFIFSETLGMVVFVLGVLIGMPMIGIASTGVAFLALYMVYLPIIWWAGRRTIGFRWTSAVKRNATQLMTAALVVEVAARMSGVAGALTGTALSMLIGISTIRLLRENASISGKLGRIISRAVK